MSEKSREAALKPGTFFKDLNDFSREGYINYLIDRDYAKDTNEILSDRYWIWSIFRHWHKEGRQGCSFAVSLSNQTSIDSSGPYGWEVIQVDSDRTGVLSEHVIDEIKDKTSASIADPKINSLSFLFPQIAKVESVINLLLSLEQIDGWAITQNKAEFPPYKKRPEMISLGLRIRIDKYKGLDVLAYGLGFAPIPHIGQTRQSPITEIIFMVKPKAIPPIFARLDPDPLYSHLADHKFLVDSEKKEGHFNNIWDDTQALKRKRLEEGGFHHKEPSTKAKCVYAVPKQLWLDMQNS